MSRASCVSAIVHLLVSCSVLLQVAPTAHLVAAVSPGRLNKLTREELVRLDEEVAQFYSDSYADLDAKNETFEEQLYKTIRSLRHTTIFNIYDFRYTSDDIKWRSMGSRVDRELCKHQLNSLVRIANSTMAPETHSAPTDQLPLSVINFFGASGLVGSGLLNGNFIWLGSPISCEREKVPAETLTKYSDMGGNSELSKRDLQGRYCVAHLRATSWPKMDIYFEDRITIRRGLCLPQACHTALYEQDAEIRRHVDILARTNLLAPFNKPGRFEVSHLYCYPDEDSEFRQLDLGTKLFVAFVCFWLLLTIWANHKYAQRRQALSQLCQTVDTRERPTGSARPEGRADEEDGERGEFDSKPLGGSASRSSLSPADPPGPKPTLADEAQMALIKALSIKANLSFLLEPRPSSSLPKRNGTNVRDASGAGKSRSQSVSSSKVARELTEGAIDRRKSSSKEVLEEKELRESNVSRVAGPRCVDQEVCTDRARYRRLNLEILDGLKVIATSYIVLAHVVMYSFGMFSNLRHLSDHMLGPIVVFGASGAQLISLFYIIAGCLMTYLSFSKAKLSQLQNPLYLMLVPVGRYIRFIPAYALVYWFAHHVAPYVGSGPFWFEYRTDADYPRTQCSNESWWVMWSMSAADVKMLGHCLPQAWHISDDFRTFMVLPVFIFLLTKSVRAGYAAILVTFAASTMRTGHVLRTANIDLKTLLKWKPHFFAIMQDRLPGYTDFLVRLGAYLLGVILGHLLYLYETRAIRRWPRGLVKHLMWLASLMAVINFFAIPLSANPSLNQFLPSRDQLDSDSVAWLIILSKIAMEICICVILLYLLTSNINELTRCLLGSRTMRILGNLTYAVFLVHFEVITKTPLSQYEVRPWYFFLYAGFYLSTSYAVGFFLHLLWETPINNLTRNLLKRVFHSIS